MPLGEDSELRWTAKTGETTRSTTSKHRKAPTFADMSKDRLISGGAVRAIGEHHGP